MDVLFALLLIDVFNLDENPSLEFMNIIKHCFLPGVFEAIPAAHLCICLHSALFSGSEKHTVLGGTLSSFLCLEKLLSRFCNMLWSLSIFTVNAVQSVLHICLILYSLCTGLYSKLLGYTPSREYSSEHFRIHSAN